MFIIFEYIINSDMYNISSLPKYYKNKILLFLKYCSMYKKFHDNKKIIDKYIKMKIYDYICVPLYDKYILQLHNAQKDIINKKIFDEIKYKKKIKTIIVPIENNTNNYKFYDFFMETYDTKHVGYTNFKIINGTESIRYIELECGGSTTDINYPQITNYIYPFSIMKKNKILPRAKYHNYKICIHCSKSCTISYDIVNYDIVNYDSGNIISKKSFSFLCNQNKYVFIKNNLMPSNHIYNLYFYCIIRSIKVYNVSNIKNLLLIMDDMDDHTNRHFVTYKESNIIGNVDNLSDKMDITNMHKIPFYKKENYWKLNFKNANIPLYINNIFLSYDTYGDNFSETIIILELFRPKIFDKNLLGSLYGV